MTAEGFNTKLIVSPVIGRRGFWRLEQILVFMAADQEVFVVPAGFQTNLASIPRALRWLFTVNDNSRQASVVHDYLYGNAWHPRKQCDKYFYEAMLCSQVPKWKAKLMYWGVRAGGWAAWNK